MSASAASLDDTAMTSSSSLTSSSDVNRVLRLTGAKSSSRLFNIPWKHQSTDDNKNATKNSETCAASPEAHSNSKNSNGFFENIKKRLRIKNLSLCKAKQKIKAIDLQRQTEEAENAAPPLLERPVSFGGDPERSANERINPGDSDSSLRNGIDETLQNEADACWESYGALSDRGNTSTRDDDDDAEKDLRLGGELSSPRDEENDEECSVVRTGNVAEPQSTTARESVEDGADPQLSNECKAKVTLSEELLKLSKYGWYWGPISGDEADSKLLSEPDGAFLVRDSSDHKYLLTLSFKSSGKLLHARMEHTGGLFSLCNQSENEGFTSVAALIDHSMTSSQSAVFCFSRPRYPGCPSFPVRLTKPVSRFTQVRSLQYLCRFVIRQNTRLDNIHKLPLPKTIRGYVEEAHY